MLQVNQRRFLIYGTIGILCVGVFQGFERDNNPFLK